MERSNTLEILLPETKPETEWVRGRALRKVSPTYRHAKLQSLLAIALTRWADAASCGRVGTEWRFRVNPPDDVVRPLVPDVAYLSYADLPASADDAAQLPLGVPTVAFEVRSPDDRTADIADKIETYLRAGTRAVVLVDPATRTIACSDFTGLRTFGDGGVFTHVALPAFELDVTGLFDGAMR